MEKIAERIKGLMEEFPAMVAEAEKAGSDTGHILEAQRQLAMAREVLITSAYHLHRAIDEMEGEK